MFHRAVKHGSEWISRTFLHKEIQKVAILKPLRSSIATPIWLLEHRGYHFKAKALLFDDL
jgi:hypothetical protein